MTQNNNREIRDMILNRIDFITEYRAMGLQFEGTTPNADGWVSCHAYDREDRNASAAVNLNNGYYIDLGDTDKNADFFKFAKRHYGFPSFPAVLDYYKEKYGLTNPSQKAVPVPLIREPHTIDVEAMLRGRKPWELHPEADDENVPSLHEVPEENVTETRKATPDEQIEPLPWNDSGDWWCGIKNTNSDAVKRAGGFLCRYKGYYMCVSFPVFNHQNTRKANGFVVEAVNGSELPKYNASGELIGSTKCKLVAGTKSGLVGKEALETIQAAREAGTLDELTVFKVEGITDLTALLARIPQEKRGKWLVLTNACGANEVPKKEWKKLFEGLNVVLIHDADDAGEKGAKEWCQFLSGTAAHLRNVKLPYEVTPNHGKDVKDYLSEHSIEEFMKLVNETPEYQEVKKNEPEPNDPYRIANLFLKENYTIQDDPDQFTLIFQEGEFSRWYYGGYREMTFESLNAAVSRFTEKLFKQDFENEIRNCSGSEKPRKYRVTRNLVADIINAIQSIVFSEEKGDFFWRGKDCPEEFKKTDLLIPFRNGILNFSRLEEEWKAGRSSRDWNDYLMPPTPLFFNRYVFDFDYDGNARCEEWEKLIEETLVDEKDGKKDWSKYYFLQEFFGYCLTRDTSLHQYIMMVGEGGNGKSAVLTGFSTMIGEENTSNIPLEQFDDKFALINMRGKLVNIVDDLSDTGSNSEGKLKSIVSGQTISSDRKYKSQISFEPTARLIFACNTLPRHRDKSNGFFRRLTILRFNKTIPESKKRPEFTTKKFWKQKVAGIFNWCLDGLLHLRCDDNHFYPCPESDEIIEEYKYFGNPTLRFLDEYVEVDPNWRVLTQVLFEKYKTWAKDHGHLPVSSETLGMDIKRKFNIDKKRSGGKPRKNYYPGIRLIDEDF
ncbi:MAG: hypothetical protein IJQ31_00355 [Thermoguttaceae bacterium]|nr:hypothetical protein [Thermoguttaceae bacterium]